MSLKSRARTLRNNPTNAEQKLWQHIRADQLGTRFRRQHPHENYVLDFYCPSHKLCIEVDGGQHADNPQDPIRTAKLNAHGITVLRFWNNDVLANIEGVLQTITMTLNQTTLPPMPPSRTQEGSAQWRKDFPALSVPMNGKPVAFLDSGASAQKPQCVIDALSGALSGGYANIHRGVYAFSQNTTAAFEAARVKVATFIGAHENEIIFTRNATEGVNLVAQSWARTHLKSGDDIIITAMEHHANIVPWQLAAAGQGVNIKHIPLLENGALDIANIPLSNSTKLVAFTHMSNALGTINPAIDLIKQIRAYNPNIKILLDCSQSAVHMPINVQNLDADFIVFTGHKLYGPNGIGVLWGRADVLNDMPPYQGGGDMVDIVTLSGTTFKQAPARFEAGTPAIAEAIALGAAIDYITQIGFEAITQREHALSAKLDTALRARTDIRLIGADAPTRGGIFSFLMPGTHPSDVGMVLDQCGVAVRTGHHCCQPLMQRFGITGTIRASLALYNDETDIDALMTGLDKAAKLLK